MLSERLKTKRKEEKYVKFHSLSKPQRKSIFAVLVLLSAILYLSGSTFFQILRDNKNKELRDLTE